MLTPLFISILFVDSVRAIVGGGVEARANEFPWAVRLEGCGGALISQRHILTAAHCLLRPPHPDRPGEEVRARPENIWIYLGGHAGPQVPEPTALYFSSIKDVLLPYDGARTARGYRWDLALLEIDPINFTSTVRPIKIAPSKPPVGESVTLAGWGFLNRSKPAHALHKIDLQVIDDCDYYASVTGQFCARHPNSEYELKDACLGDSGSPLMVRHKEPSTADEWRLAGIMSAGYTSDVEDCEKLGGFSAYADLSHPLIRAWLAKFLADGADDDARGAGPDSDDGRRIKAES